MSGTSFHCFLGGIISCAKVFSKSIETRLMFKTDVNKNKIQNLFNDLVISFYFKKPLLNSNQNLDYFMSLEIYSSSETSHDSPLSSSHAGFDSLFSNIAE
jgi:hypothetical protein